MHNEFITKRSPAVLMWKFAAVEAGGLILYLVASALGDAKYFLYTKFFLASALPYMTARIVFLFGAQFAMIVYVFLSWYWEEYKIRPTSIVHLRGVFKKRQTVFPISKLSAVETKENIIGKIFHYGSVEIKNGSEILKLKHISRPERIKQAIEEGPLTLSFSTPPDIGKMLNAEENEQLEFKSSLRHDYKAGNVNRELEKAALKTVAAFLNSKGGYLVLGVSDRREPIGLKNDIKTLQKKDRDGFENHFTQAFNSAIGPGYRNLIKLWFHEVGGHEICVIEARPSARPVYFKTDSTEYFYMRTGNITTALKLSELESYLRSRWPKRFS